MEISRTGKGLNAESSIDRSAPILVAGGGVGGMSAAILLRRLGFPVDIVEIDPEWRVYGAGISITSSTFRAFKALGILEDVCASGFGGHGPMRIHNPAGVPIAEIPAPTLEPGLPSGGGIMRPELHRIMRRHTIDSGARVRLGIGIEDLSEDATGVHVRFSDASQRDYQAVIGADGVFSKLRAALFPQVPAPRYTGQHCWRLVAARPPEIMQHCFFMAGETTAGLMPCSTTQMYMWLLETAPEKIRLAPHELPGRLREIMAPFGGILGQLRDGLDAESQIVVRPLEALLLPRPWYRGRVLLIGDAAHATTPHLASGAGIAVEDALVLSDSLAGADTFEAAFDIFMERRWERCRMVVESSVRIGDMQQAHAAPDELKAVIGSAEAALRAAI